MKYFSLLLSMLVVTAAVAQKPFDRGIHKRTTGGVSFLFGEKKAKDADNMDVVTYDDMVALETMAPSLVANDVAPATLLDPQVASFAMAEPMEVEEVILTNRVLRKLNRKGLTMVAGPTAEKRLFRRANPLVAASEAGEGGYDWAAITGLAIGVLGLFVPFIWLLGVTFSAIGLSNTGDGGKKGKGMAIVGLVLSILRPILFWTILAAALSTTL